MCLPFYEPLVWDGITAQTEAPEAGTPAPPGPWDGPCCGCWPEQWALGKTGTCGSFRIPVEARSEEFSL